MKQKTHTKNESGRIILAVSGGVVSLVDAPEGTDIEVRDYDIEGMDGQNMKTDVDGVEYREIFV